MAEIITTVSTAIDMLNQWLLDLQADDHAPGTIRRYKSAIESFLTWYEQEEHRPLTLDLLTPDHLDRLSQLPSADAGTRDEHCEWAYQCVANLGYLAD